MIASKNLQATELIVVTHPMFDVPESKCSVETLGQIKMSPTVRISLFALQAYLIVMALILSYHMLDLAGLLGHHVAK